MNRLLQGDRQGQGQGQRQVRNSRRWLAQINNCSSRWSARSQHRSFSGRSTWPYQHTYVYVQLHIASVSRIQGPWTLRPSTARTDLGHFTAVIRFERRTTTTNLGTDVQSGPKKLEHYKPALLNIVTVLPEKLRKVSYQMFTACRQCRAWTARTSSRRLRHWSMLLLMERCESFFQWAVIARLSYSTVIKLFCLFCLLLLFSIIIFFYFHVYLVYEFMIMINK